MWNACSSGPGFRPTWRVPGPRSSTGRFSAMRCRTSRCRGQGSRRCWRNCSESRRDIPLHASIGYATGAKSRAGDQSMTASPERLEGTVDPKLLEILVCPLTKGPLEYDAAKQELISRSAKLAYPIRDGIPIMLPEEARKIE